MEYNGKTILDYFKPITHSTKSQDIQYFPAVKQGTVSMESKIGTKRKRCDNDSYGCIVIDDDEEEDIQVIEQQEQR